MAMALAIFWVAKSRTDSWIVLAAILLGLCVAIILNSQHRTLIRISPE